MGRASIFSVSEAATTSLAVRGQVLKVSKVGKKRARKVIGVSNEHSTYKHPSWKNKTTVHCESKGELNACRLLDADPSVARYREQPLEIHFELDGVTHMHTPDLLVVRWNGDQELWEVKSERGALQPFLQARSALLARELPTLGYTYRVVLAEDLKSEPRLKHVTTILQHSRRDVTDVEQLHAQHAFSGQRSLHWDEVREVLGVHGREIVCRLAVEGHLAWDPSSPTLCFKLTTLSHVPALGGQ